MAKYRFKLIRGIYEDGDKRYVAKKPGADRIETDIPLDEKYGADKFQRLGGGETAETEAPANNEEDQGPDLEAMTVAELKDFAASEEIDLGTAHKKDEIINTIRQALETR